MNWLNRRLAIFFRLWNRHNAIGFSLAHYSFIHASPLTPFGTWHKYMYVMSIRLFPMIPNQYDILASIKGKYFTSAPYMLHCSMRIMNSNDCPFAMQANDYTVSSILNKFYLSLMRGFFSQRKKRWTKKKQRNKTAFGPTMEISYSWLQHNLVCILYTVDGMRVQGKIKVYSMGLKCKHVCFIAVNWFINYVLFSSLLRNFECSWKNSSFFSSPEFSWILPFGPLCDSERNKSDHTTMCAFGNIFSLCISVTGANKTTTEPRAKKNYTLKSNERENHEKWVAYVNLMALINVNSGEFSSSPSLVELVEFFMHAMLTCRLSCVFNLWFFLIL